MYHGSAKQTSGSGFSRVANLSRVQREERTVTDHDPAVDGNVPYVAALGRIGNL